VLVRALSNLVEGLLLAMMVVLCADVFLGVFSRYVLMSTFTWYDEIARLFQRTPVMGLSKQYVYAAIPAGGILIILYSLPLLRAALRGGSDRAPA
jgi:TRAP-type C4-dicarboxylate transport system permease small subunit